MIGIKEAIEIREQLSSDKRKIGFFLGAGTSMALTLSGIVKLTELVSSELNEPFKTQYKNVKKELSKDADVNVEDVLNRIRLYRELIGNSETQEYCGIKGKDTAKELDIAVCKQISEVVGNLPKEITPLYLLYMISERTSLANDPFMKPRRRSSPSVSSAGVKWYNTRAMITDPDKLASAVKKLGEQLGFDLLGITSAEPLPQPGQKLRQAIRLGCTAKMGYLQRNPTQRAHPQAIFPWASSIISVGICYLCPPPSTTKNPQHGLISRYALGRDYHQVLAEKLKLFRDELPGVVGRDFRSRVAVDTSALMEKPLAQRAGLGWLGKNSLIINPTFGSWIFLGELITELDLSTDEPTNNQCGDCRACIDACPTGALSATGLLDARKCLSYLTVEHKGPIPTQIRAKLTQEDACVYGCDICQEVCPFNRDTPKTKEPQFCPRDEIVNLSIEGLFRMSEAKFEKVFCDTPMARLSYQRFRRNLELLRDA